MNALLTCLRGADKFWRTAILGATGLAGDGPLFLLDYALRLVRVVVLLSLWRAILGPSGGASGMSLAAVLSYTLVSQAFAAQVSPRTDLDYSIWEGSIAQRFLRPMDLVSQCAAVMAGKWLLGLCVFSVPLLFAAQLLGVNPLPATPRAGALFSVSLAMGVSVGIALDFLFAALMVAIGWSVWDVDRLRSALTGLLSGAVIPLALLPWNLGSVLAWLPFAALASAPLQIYTGTGDPLPLLAGQLAWSLALWPAARVTWRLARQRVVLYGG